MKVTWNNAAQAIEIKFERTGDKASITGISATGTLDKRVVSSCTYLPAPPSLNWDINPLPNGTPPISNIPPGAPFIIQPPPINGSYFLKPSFLDANHNVVFYPPNFMQFSPNLPNDQGTPYNFTFIADRSLGGDGGQTNIVIMGEDTGAGGPQGCLPGFIKAFIRLITGGSVSNP